MDSVLGPLSEGRLLVTFAVLVGVCLVGVGTLLSESLGVSLPDSSILAVAGFAGGLGLVLLGHVAWHTD